MPTWNSRGLRGSAFEELINYTHEIYHRAGLCLIQKVPTPITAMEYDKEKGHITLAYFDKKSTVDYIGAVQGIPVCFDAKECVEARFPLANIHEHQMEFMGDFEKQGGAAFFLIHFSKAGGDRYYYLRYNEALDFWNRAKDGGRKSFRIDELCERYFFYGDDEVPVPYLSMLDQDLEERKHIDK